MLLRSAAQKLTPICVVRLLLSSQQCLTVDWFSDVRLLRRRRDAARSALRSPAETLAQCGLEFRLQERGFHGIYFRFLFA